MVFYTCAICEIEHGLQLMVDLEEVMPLIQGSGISDMYQQMLLPLSDPNSTPQVRAYARAAQLELDGGLLVGASHVCHSCVRYMRRAQPTRKRRTTANLNDASDYDTDDTDDSSKSEASVEACGGVPPLALVNGYFRGKCPPELACLNRTEVSLVARIDLFITISMLQGGGHWGSRGPVFSVMNDVVEIASFLPKKPSPTAHAIIKKRGTSSAREYKYNPHTVLAALTWLEANNGLYTGRTALVHMDESTPDPLWTGSGVDADVDPDYISGSDSDLEGVGDEAPAGDDGHAVNPGAPPSFMAEVFLQGEQAYSSNVHQVKAILQKQPPATVTVRADGEYVKDSEQDDFMAMAFPVLYPYGKGAPNTSGIKFSSTYISHVLHLGGARPFQQNSGFIFYSYAWVMRSRIGNVTYRASKHDETQPHGLTVAEVQAFLDSLKENPTESGISKAEQRALLQRLQPYATQLPGTELYFEKERKNLLAMISSPVTTSEGEWTWFFTEAQPDKYLVEIFDNAITSARNLAGIATLGIGSTIEDRRARSNALTETERNEILKDHPFMSARIHGLQQEAFWKYVLNGEDKPLGEIIDWWLRAEFQMKGTPHWHTLISIMKRWLNGVDKKSVESEDPAIRQKVIDLVNATATATLVERDPDDCKELPPDDTRELRRATQK